MKVAGPRAGRLWRSPVPKFSPTAATGERLILCLEDGTVFRNWPLTFLIFLGG